MTNEEGSSREVATTASEPVALVRWLIALAQKYGAVGLTYHVSSAFDSFQNTRPHIFFVGEDRFSRHMLPEDHAEVLGRCNEFLVELGKPIILSRYLEAFAQVEPRLTKEIMLEAGQRGVKDQFMTPAFGPFKQNGVVTFAFPRILDWKGDAFLSNLEAAASTFHTKIVRHFGTRKHDDDLSPRENEVLSWIAKGKTTLEIGAILGVSKSSVDTYTRRIFEKMGVHDRVSAAVKGVRSGLIS